MCESRKLTVVYCVDYCPLLDRKKNNVKCLKP